MNELTPRFLANNFHNSALKLNYEMSSNETEYTKFLYRFVKFFGSIEPMKKLLPVVINLFIYIKLHIKFVESNICEVL